MNFTEPHLKGEFRALLHHEARDVVMALDTWSLESGLPEVVVTHVIRTPGEQQRIYIAYANRLIYRRQIQDAFSPSEQSLADDLAKMTEGEINRWAFKRFSWHLIGCAVDIRSKHYELAHLSAVMEYLRERCPKPEWELIEHDVSGPHVHIARRDQSRRVTEVDKPPTS
jgi:hypothetical protein